MAGGLGSQSLGVGSVRTSLLCPKVVTPTVMASYCVETQQLCSLSMLPERRALPEGPCLMWIPSRLGTWEGWVHELQEDFGFGAWGSRGAEPWGNFHGIVQLPSLGRQSLQAF